MIVNAVEQRRYYEFSGEMDLGSVSTIVSASALEAWVTLTGGFFAGYLDKVGASLSPSVRGTTMTLTVTNNRGLFFEFDAKTDFITDSSANHDPGFLLLGILEDTDEFFDYITVLLQSGEPAFNNLTSLSLSVDGAVEVAPPASNWIGPSPTEPPVPQPTDFPTTEPTKPPTTRPATEPPTVAPVAEASTVTWPPVDEPEDSQPEWQSPGTDPQGGGDDDDLNTFYVTTELVLRDTLGEMGPTTLETWRNVTGMYLVDYIHSLLEEEDKKRLGMDFLGIRQIRQEFGRERRQRSIRHRQLQTSDESESYKPLFVEFVSRLSLFRKYDAKSIVNGAFATIRRRRTYLDLLIETAGENDDTFFEAVNEVVYGDDFESGDQSVSADESKAPEEENSSTLGIIAGVAVGVIAFVVALAVIYFMNKRGKTTGSQGGFPDASNPEVVKSPNGTGGLSWEEADGPGVNFNKEIVVEKMDDVSTIGDPFTVYTEDERTTTDRTVGTKSVTQTMLYSYLLGGMDEKEQSPLEPPSSPNSRNSSILMGTKFLKDPQFCDLDSSMLGEQPSAEPSTLVGLGLLGNDDGASSANISKNQ